MPETVGKTLKKIRESKGLAVEEVSERTRIPKKIISNIEEDMLQEIGSQFYARSFVKTYSQFLGATEENAVREYLGGAEKKDETVLVLEGERVPGDWFEKHKRHVGTALLAVLAIWVVGLSFIQMGKFIKNSSAKYNAYAARKEEARKLDKVPVAAPAPAPVKEVTKAEPEKIEGVMLEITARSDTWIQVVGDGELLFQGIFKRGTSDVWQAEEEIELELGNAGGVTLKLNEEDIGVAGKKREKKKVIITKDGIKE